MKLKEITLKFRGATSSMKDMPGGGPQGTILGMFLFIVLINPVEFGQNEKLGEIITARNFQKMRSSHFKYIDDLTFAEAIQLKTNLEKDPNIVLPATFHQRTGHKLKNNICLTQPKIFELEDFAEQNEMKINTSKCKVMLFNRSKNFDFEPVIRLKNTEKI